MERKKKLHQETKQNVAFPKNSCPKKCEILTTKQKGVRQKEQHIKEMY